VPGAQGAWRANWAKTLACFRIAVCLVVAKDDRANDTSNGHFNFVV
jgi:hypothetical protein